MKNPLYRLLINTALVFIGFIVVYSGFLIQLCYHMGQHGVIDFTKTVLLFNYSSWSNIHKIAILLLTIFMVFHFVQHWNWFKTIIKKNLIQKNKQVFILSTVFILAAITGYISWLIDLTGNDQRARTVFLEIHDKLTIILSLFLILHIAKRLKWFRVTIKRIINNEFTQQ